MIRVHRYFCCCLIVGAASLFATPWKTIEKLSHEEQQLQAKRERSDGTHLIEGLNSDEILSSLQEREAASQQLKLPVEVEEKTDETSWLEEERSFWEERQEWLVEMERAFHTEPSFEKREIIFKKVAALVEDAQEAEKDLREADSKELALKIEVEVKNLFTKTIDAIEETKRLGKLFLSSYNDLSNGVSTSQFADKVANCVTDPSAPKQTILFAANEEEMTTVGTSSQQPLKKSNGLAPKYAIYGTDPFFVKRVGRALVGFLATSSMVPRQAFSSVSSLGSLGALRGLGSLGSLRSIGSLGAASFFLSRFPRAEAREEYFSPSAFSNVQNLTSSGFQHLNLTSPDLIPYSFSPSSLPVSLSRERNRSELEQRREQDIIPRRLENSLVTTPVSSSAITQAHNDLKRTEKELPIIPPPQNSTDQLDALEEQEKRRRLQDALSSEFQISTLTTGDNQKPTVAAFSGGGYVVTWYNIVSPYQIYGRRYDSSGNAIGSSEFKISTITTGSNYSPTVAVLNGGGFVVTWYNGAPNNQIYGRRYDSSGNAIGSSEFKISTRTTGDNQYPTVAALSGGGFVVTWHNVKIYGRRYDSSGNAIGSSEFQINTLTIGNNQNPTVATLSDGGFIVTWHNTVPPNQIYGRRYDSSGNAIGSSEFQISTLTTDNNVIPTIAALSAGGFVVTWYNIVSPYQIYGRRYDSSGNAIGASEFQISTLTAGNNQSPTVAALSDGGFLVTWYNIVSPNTIYGRRYNSNGNEIGTSEFQINTNTGGNQYPSIAILTGSSYVVTYQGGSSPVKIYARLLASISPTSQPSTQPTSQPSIPTSQPTRQPTAQPFSKPSSQPSCQPTTQPSSQPTRVPSSQPTVEPTRQPSSQPTAQPSGEPTSQPTEQPSLNPSSQPTVLPTSQPTGLPSSQPTDQPSFQPSGNPTSQPTGQPSLQPMAQPSTQPSTQPSSIPTGQPTTFPTTQPTTIPTSQPSRVPSSQPSSQPTSQPSSQPTIQPVSNPSTQPTGLPTTQPTGEPSSQPTTIPTSQPSRVPSSQPSLIPTSFPSGQPSVIPTSQPSSFPSTQPSGVPSSQPTRQPTEQPSSQPTSQPSQEPTIKPTSQPSGQPSYQSTSEPTSQPSSHPSVQPSSQPTRLPSAQPSTDPTSQPSSQPTAQPSRQPILRPTSRPTAQPSSFPTLKENPLLQGWMALLGPESQSSAITSLENQGLFLSKESDPVSLFHLNTSNGALLAHYELPWAQTQTLLSSSLYESLYALTHWNNSTPFVKALVADVAGSVDNNKFTGSYLLHPQVNYHSAFFHPFYNLPILLGRDHLNRSVITLADAELSSSVPFSFPLKMAAQKMASSSSAAVSFFAGTRTTDSGSALEAGLVNFSPIPTLKKWIQLTPAGNKTTASSVFSNSLSVTATTLLPESQDPMIAGTINFRNLPHSYLARISSLNSLSTVSCAQLLQGCGAIQDFFTKENSLYAICNTLSQLGNPSKLKLLQLDSSKCQPHSPHTQVSGPGDIVCSQVTPMPTGFAFACTLNQAQGLTFLTDQNLTFNNLPPRYQSTLANDLTTQPLNLTLTSLLSYPIRATYFKPEALTGSFSIPARGFTQLLPDDFYQMVPLPTKKPTPAPTAAPTITSSPTVKSTSSRPSIFPSRAPSLAPSLSFSPTSLPSTAGPTRTHRPSFFPSSRPSRVPFSSPTRAPSAQPLVSPTKVPMSFASLLPSFIPTLLPSLSPTVQRSIAPSFLKTHAPTHLRRTGEPTIYSSPSMHPIYIYDPYQNFSSKTPHEEPWYRSSSFTPLYVVMGMNIPLIAYVLYHSCIKASEEEQKKAIADIEELEDQHSSSVSSQSSRASSPLPSGFSDISVDESQLLEEFLHGSNLDELSLSHHSSYHSSRNPSPVPSISPSFEEMRDQSPSPIETMEEIENNFDDLYQVPFFFYYPIFSPDLSPYSFPVHDHYPPSSEEL